VAVAGPAVAVDAGLAVGLILAFFAFVCCLALRAGWSATLGLLFSEVARALHKIPTFGIGGVSIPGIGTIGRFTVDVGGWVAKPFETADHLVYSSLGTAIAKSEHAWHECLSALAYVTAATGDEIARLSEETLHGLEWLHHKTSVPALWRDIRPLVHDVTSTLPTAKVIVRPATKAAVDAYPALARRVAHLEHELAHVGTRTIVVPGKEIAKAADGTITRAMPAVLNPPLIKPLEIDLSRLKARVGSLAKLLAPAAILGLVATAIGRLGLGWTRCSRVKDAGKHLCGMDAGLLESLLADTLLIAGTVSLVEFARGMQEVTKEVVGPIKTFWRVA
jgi:hypothetical protein